MQIQWMFFVSGIIFLCCSSVVNGAGRIVGGEIVNNRTAYPFFATLTSTRVNSDGAKSYGFCGGTLISPTAVLTAAHCVDNPNIVEIEVELGAIRLNDLNTEVVPVISGEILPGFSRSSGEGDLAVVRLLRPVQATPADIVFGDLKFPDTNDPVTIIGFGFTEAGGDLSQELRQVTVDVRAPNRCGAFNLTVNGKRNRQFCAGGNGEVPCNGDSGGPALVNERIVAGITSFGSGCNNQPSVFTRVSRYESFIRGVVCNGNGQAKWCSNDPVDGTKDAPPVGGFGCFHGATLVEVADGRDKVHIKDLKLGDEVHVGNGVYEPIYSFGHLSPETDALFLQISTERSQLLLTPDHMLFTPLRGAVPCSLLNVGDYLIDTSGVPDRISNIKAVNGRGLYAPFTPSGKIIVNNLLASAYVALEESEGLQVFGVQLSHQWLYHAVQFPHRLACHHLGKCWAEKYNSQGISKWMEGSKVAAEWLLSQPTNLRFLWVIPLGLVATIFTVGEFVVARSVLLLAIMVAAILCKRCLLSKGAYYI